MGKRKLFTHTRNRTHTYTLAMFSFGLQQSSRMALSESTGLLRLINIVLVTLLLEFKVNTVDDPNVNKA